MLTPILGLLAFIGPWIVAPPEAYLPSPLFPILRHSLEKIGGTTLGLLFVVGLVVGLFSRLPAWGIGLAAIALLPIASVAEMVVDASSHDLLPFELVFDALYGSLAALGALVVRLLLRRESQRV